jgi:4-alpha-glucanotransferase
MSDPARPALAALADRLGVFAGYHDIQGTPRPTSDATREALCTAMGFACASEAEASQRLAELDAEAAMQIVAPVQVFRALPDRATTLRVRAPASAAPVTAELQLAGARSEVTLPAGDGLAWTELALPAPLEPGAHPVRLSLGGRAVEQLLIVAPATAYRADEALGARRALGVWTNLYTVRSRTNAGFGDFGDLARLANGLGELGVDFVALNPLHAILNRGHGIAPYSPISRVFGNPMYIELEAVPEFASAEKARAVAAQLPLARFRSADVLDHAELAAAKLQVLRELHRALLAGERSGETERGRAVAAALAAAGPELADFATFEVLQAELREADWRVWPAELRDPRSSAVREFAAAHPEAIAFRAWLQLELERQLERAAETARGAGMRIGLCKDLAIGSAPDSADTWMCRELFADGASLGAPPDAYAAAGQDWGLPPLIPHRLRADGYRFLCRLLRSAFRSAGALRLDHVMGLQRQFWIPAGRPGSEGTYVAQPADELFGVLALESRRAKALVVGEDLGTVPSELAPQLESWGVLSTRVLCFERDGIEFRPSGAYPPRALALAVTHDLPPLAGWLEGRDLELRADIGEPGALAGLLDARALRAEERAALERRLRAEGELEGVASPADADTLSRAAQRFVARTPSRLVALGLDDLAGEREPLNLPGVPVERHRSWSRRMRRELDDLLADSELRALLQTTAARAEGDA